MNAHSVSVAENQFHILKDHDRSFDEKLPLNEDNTLF